MGYPDNLVPTPLVSPTSHAKKNKPPKKPGLFILSSTSFPPTPITGWFTETFHLIFISGLTYLITGVEQLKCIERGDAWICPKSKERYGGVCHAKKALAFWLYRVRIRNEWIICGPYHIGHDSPKRCTRPVPALLRS